jgi:plastocyanin
MARTRTLTVVGALLSIAALASCAQSEPARNRRQPTTHTVIMEGMVFRPDVITVATGDTIVWLNKDMVPHSATSAAAGFDSQVIAANKSWRYMVHQEPGDFDYICSYHPTTMTAKVEVR